MKSVSALIVFSVLFLNGLYGGCGIYEHYLNILSPSSAWYGNNNTPLNGAVLSNNIILNSSTLNIETRGINTWNDNGSQVTSARFNYRVYKQGTSAPNFTVVNLTYQGENGNNKYWNNNNPQINLLQGLTTTGTYVFEVYFDATSNCQSGCNCTIYESNNGNNFIATFIVTGTLPIDLIYFDALLTKDNSVKLSWESNAVGNTEMFEIQHSRDSKTFSTFEKIKVNGETKFEFFHYKKTSGISYYRLKQTDKDGVVTYSPIRVVEADRDQIQLSPNPTNKILSIQGLGNIDQTVTIHDQSGKEVYRTKVSSDSLNVDLQGLLPGIYFVRIINMHDSNVFRLIKS